MIGLPVLAMSVMFEQVQSGKGFLIKTNGDVVPFYPTEEHEGSKVYDMNSVRKACNFKYFEIAYLNDNMMFICDEEGLYATKVDELSEVKALYVEKDMLTTLSSNLRTLSMKSNNEEVSL